MAAMTEEQARAWMSEQAAEARRVAAAVEAMTPRIASLALRIAERLAAGGQIFFFGNGGSAADAQHWAAELSGRFYRNRPGLPAHALTTNASQITAIANDFGYDEIFSRPLAGLANPGDVAVGLSTSGGSANVIRALDIARDRGLLTAGFTGAGGAAMGTHCDTLIVIPSHDVARIQEGHELCGHLLCAVIERTLFGSSDL